MSQPTNIVVSAATKSKEPLWWMSAAR